MDTQKSHIENDTFLAQWLEGKLLDNELKELVSESDYTKYLKIRKGLEVLDAFNAPTDSTFTQIQQKIKSKNNKVIPLNYKPWLLAIAASIVLFFGLFSIFDTNQVAFETGYGEFKTIALLDGSEVILNSKSSLSYNEKQWESNKTVELNGEAFFKVKKGSVFTVTTSNGIVKVLGTHFNVQSHKDLFEITCYEGKVSVLSKSETFILLPTNTLRRINGNAIEAWNTEFNNPTWLNGESNFKSVPVEYVISALEAQYQVKINSQNIDTSIIYTGSFTHNNLETALQTVFKSLQIQYIEKENRKIDLVRNE